MISINKNTLYRMFEKSNLLIQKDYEYINKLNVFPVPDGDTGSNMMTTLKGALEEIHNLEEYSLYEFTKKLSRSLLMNAHGNSGVILSQILKGFFEPIKEDTRHIDVGLLINSFNLASKAAYKVVDKPKEGTMLTVIREISEYLNANKDKYKTIEEVFKDVLFSGNIALQKTPELLPVLKKAKVVDSGGYGLMTIFEGMYQSISNNEIKVKENDNKIEEQYEKNGINSDFISNSEEGYGYCCEFIIEINATLDEDPNTNKIPFNKEEIISKLNKIGNSLVIVNDDIFCKVHIHSLNPNKILEIGQQYGEFHKIKIENMTLQKNKNNGIDTLNKSKKNSETITNLDSEIKVVATVPNFEIAKILNLDFGVEKTLNRENNQNPSVKNFIDLIRSANSNKVILVIDNKDCFLAACKAVEEINSSSKDISIQIINCIDILQSIVAILNFNKFLDFNEIVKTMNKAVKKITSIKITKSAKNISSKKLKVNKDDYIIIDNKNIISASKELTKISEIAIRYVINNKKHSKNKTMFLIFSNLLEKNFIDDIEKYLEKNMINYEIIIGGKDTYLMYIGE